MSRHETGYTTRQVATALLLLLLATALWCASVGALVIIGIFSELPPQIEFEAALLMGSLLCLVWGILDVRVAAGSRVLGRPGARCGRVGVVAGGPSDGSGRPGAGTHNCKHIPGGGAGMRSVVARPEGDEGQMPA
jgi:hypothetical protein